MNYTDKEKILLLSDIPPCKNYTGGLMISQMLRFLMEEKKNVSCFCVVDKNLTPEYWDDINDELDITIVDRPNEILSKDNRKGKYYSQIKKVKKQLLKYIKNNTITKIWCPLQGELLTLLLNDVYRECGIPYVVQIWDPIEWWIKEHFFDNKRAQRTLEIHSQVIKNAYNCITTSEAMSASFKKRFDVNCIEVMPGVKTIERKNYKKTNDKFIIALSGQIYAREEFDALLSALDSVKWKIGEKEVYFEYYGQWSDSYINKEKHKKYLKRIINKGFYTQDELLKHLSRVDLLYCPYFFSDDESLKMVSTLSFPSKLITYLSINVPILMHAPDYASPYIFLKKHKAAYLLDSLAPDRIINIIKKIILEDNNKEILSAAETTFNNNFTMSIMKKNFFKSLGLKYTTGQKISILEVNNIDESGRRFNGYDLIEEINTNTIHRGKQIVTYKKTDSRYVGKFFKNDYQLNLSEQMIYLEGKHMGVHSQLSLTTDSLLNSDYFKNADLVHYHLIHNTKLNLNSMIELCSQKPSILTVHDPWIFSGRCVYQQECQKWKTGCKKCNYLDTLFPLNQDNCNSLWKLKKKVFDQLDIDIIVSTPFMYNMIKESPLTTNFKHVHIVPFGLDLNKFSNSIRREEAKKQLKIPKDNLVLFFRAQMAMKGTEYIVEALKLLETDKKITLLSCSETGLLEELKGKYNVIDLGDIKDDKMIVAYNACDIFLMPSKGESFGLMAIEAMACSRPVIVFDNTALPFVTFAPECGVLVDNKNSVKLMEAIKRLIDDENERERRGKLGRKLAEEHYDIEKYHDNILKIYKEAYERQKNKKPVKIDENINYSLKDVQKTDEKLSYIYKKIFPNDRIPSFLHSKGNKYDKKVIIDYSLDDVQNLIRKYNSYMYEKISKLGQPIFVKHNIIKKICFLYVNDRPLLINKIKYRLRNHKFIYKFARNGYRFVRKVKHILIRKK